MGAITATRNTNRDPGETATMFFWILGNFTMPAAEGWTVSGISLCFGSSLLAMADGNSPIVIGAGVAAGIVFSVIGIYQKMQDGEVKRLHKRIEKLEEIIEGLELQLDAAHATIRDLRCPYSVDGKARCHDADMREVPK